MTHSLKKHPFPCLRASMGDWWYYVTVMTLKDVNRYIQHIDKIHLRAELKTWLQREIAPERLEQIADYLLSQKQHFFNAIVAGIYQGAPDWYPLSIGENLAMPDVSLLPNDKASLGFLSLSGDEQIFAIDGQHRVEGIREALKQDTGLGAEQQCVIFVSHQETPKGRKRTRRLFSTLNKYAKPVSKGEIVALSEDDTFAIVTRKLIDEYAPLNIDFVPLTKTANIPTGEKRCVTTVLGLYDLVRTLTLTRRDPRKESLEVGPPKAANIKEIFKLSRDFWELLCTNVRPIRRVAASKPADELARNYRTEDGGHVLFRPVGMKAFAKAARTMVDRGRSWDFAVERLSKTELQLDEIPWAGVLWNSEARNIINGNEKLAQNLFLYMARQPLLPGDYDLLKQYRRALDNANASLQDVPRLQ